MQANNLWNRHQAQYLIINALETLELLEWKLYDKWLKLTTSTEVKPDRAELLYIIPSKPLDLKLSS
ncbi:MAG: hypothetical protein KME05_10885 [Gloeocapsa sp. UFS-A4-WI-NPMV-4B04]|nr:hypothetical protein [Gloeocapsa sp. UFS-A4-WI-NPMV-4B04]